VCVSVSGHAVRSRDALPTIGARRCVCVRVCVCVCGGVWVSVVPFQAVAVILSDAWGRLLEALAPQPER